MPSPGHQHRVHQPAQLPLQGALISGPAVDSSFTGCCPPGPSRFSLGFSALPGPGGDPVPLTALLAGASLWVPAIRFSPVPDLWGPAPPGHPDLRQASPIPGGSGAAQCRLRLLPALTPGSGATLSGRPSRISPSAFRLCSVAARSLTRCPGSSRGGRPPGAPQFSPGLSAPPGPGSNPVPLTALHAGPPTELRLLGLVQFQIYGAQNLRGPRSPPGFSNPRGTGCGPAPFAPLPGADPWAPMLHFQGDPLGSPLRPQPSARTRRWPTASRKAPAPAEGEGRRSPLVSPAGPTPPLTPGFKRGPGHLQDRPPVLRSHLGSEFPRDGTLFLRINVGPSGARGLSVRHLRIAVHAPFLTL
ncbi:hypothetical protein NDU88_003686 [Pleurodeles waltl]|uniref:Basic proline-rich protein-like n=1 Tax=Pleurodeles waltl TaxID=8319 RepID=A0AAV7T5T1_PLEWA|nr:hypothetical protein NDU88_003686 [Pleurodeles waltl]